MMEQLLRHGFYLFDKSYINYILSAFWVDLWGSRESIASSKNNLFQNSDGREMVICIKYA